MLLLPPSIRYEDEINRRTVAENEFVTLKKVRENCRTPSDDGRALITYSFTNPSIHILNAFLCLLPWPVIAEISTSLTCEQEFKTYYLILSSSRM